MPRLLAILLAFTLSGCSLLGSSDPKQPLLTVEEYGIYRNGQLVRTTDAIPRTLGATFGLRVKVAENAPGALAARILTDTPGLIDPAAGKTVMRYETKLTLQPGKTYDVFFTFSEPWEMATGVWTLSVETDKGDEAGKKFEVYSSTM